jgi:queuine tRNA-ribosyltransferase
MTFRFEILYQSKKSQARVGKIHTPNGVIDTPGFVAVGTNGTLKSIDNEKVDSIGLQLMFCNTYHLLLQPGPSVIEKSGGLHAFINRKMPIITDSGGFQVFSLAYGSVADELKGKGKKKNNSSVLKITEEGVLFRSYRDGSKIFLTPEISIQAQKSFGADIIIPLDELPPYHIGKTDLEKSLQRTHRWEKRSLEEHIKNPKKQAIYSVIHGGVDLSLRKKSCQYLSSLPFNGHAIGGSVGKTLKEMHKMLTHTVSSLPAEFPIHLLGIGDLESLKVSIPLGIDTFDSSYPTRAARHGMLLTKKQKLIITKAEYKYAQEPIEEECNCYTCTHYKRSYLHHLFKAKEQVSHHLASIHNLHFMVKHMKDYRTKILQDLI